MSLNLSVKVRKPTRVLARPWEATLTALGRNARGLHFESCTFEPFARAVILTPQGIDPNQWTYGKAAYVLFPNDSVWAEGRSAFGEDASYVCFTGNSQYGPSTVWSAFRSPSLPLDTDIPVTFTFNWFPPDGSTLPSFEVWPRVDFSKQASINGLTYYFAPLCLYLDGANAVLSVSEYEYDTYAQFYASPQTAMRRTYQHPLDFRFHHMAGIWFSLTILPVPEKKVASDGYEYRFDDFVVRSPALAGGGFCYRTRVPRRSLSLFPSGCPGLRSLVGGCCAVSFGPVCFPSEGYVITEAYFKRQRDATRPAVDSVAYLPPGSSIWYSLLRDLPYPEVEEVPDGEEFESFRIKARLVPPSDPSGGYWKTPVLYWVGPTSDGDPEDREQTEVDASEYALLRQESSEDVGGQRVSLTLRNQEGRFNELVYRPLNEVAIDFAGKAKSVLYTSRPSFRWYESPTEAALNIEWDCGDFFERLKEMKVAAMPDYGGWTIADAVTDFLTRLGFDSTLISITPSLDSPVAVLPWSRDKDEPAYQPQDGSAADEFLLDLQEKWFSDYPMYFAAQEVGGVLKPVFRIDEPPDPFDPSDVARTFYLSQSQADSAGETDPYVVNEATVTFLHSEHRNEIYVVGEDPATRRPIMAFWVDAQSQVDESWPYYVGERRLLIVVTTLPTEAYVRMYLYNLVKVFGRLRRQVSFVSRYDPELRPGQFIRFYGISATFRVTSVQADIGPDTVVWGGPYDSELYDDRVQRANVEAVEWPA